MESFDWVSLVLGLTGGGSLVGLVVGVFTIPAAIKKAAAEARKEEAEAKATEINNMKSVADGWKELAEERQEACHEKDGRITELTAQVDARYIDIGEWRDKYNTKCEENTNLKVELANEKVKLCFVRGCLKREPQTGY